MRAREISGSVLFCTLLATTMVTVDVAAQAQSAGRRGLYGDWLVKSDFDGRQFESILSFSRDSEGKRTAQWISFRGLGELKDVKFEDGQLSFVRERQNREGETTTATFKGTIKDGKLSGALSSDRGEIKMEGARSRRMPRAVGTWELKFKIGDREITNTLVVKMGAKDQLVVDWKSDRVTREITDVKYERRKLSFKTRSKLDDRQWESTFEGTVRGSALSAAIKSDRGEIAIEGKRAAAVLVGTWILDLTSERGSRKHLISRSRLSSLEPDGRRPRACKRCRLSPDNAATPSPSRRRKAPLAQRRVVKRPRFLRVDHPPPLRFRS